jgi:hypothetical protein
MQKESDCRDVMGRSAGDRVAGFRLWGSYRGSVRSTPYWIEPLEARVAPATLSADGRTVTYVDLDGDIVTVKTSKGTFDLATNFEFAGVFGIESITRLNLENTAEFSGANITITAKRSPGGGDGLCTVGFIDASGTDLGKVVVDGDIGRIEAGDPNTATAGLKSLTVKSIGEFGTSTQVGGNLQSLINGALGSLVVKGNVREAMIDVSGGANGTVGSVKVGGSFIGGVAADSGSIESSGAMGNVTVGGDVRGGGGTLSGRIHANGKLGNVTIGGSLIGGSGGVNTGEIVAGDIGFVKIGGDVRGGTGQVAARIDAGGKLAGLTVHGSVVGSLNAATTAEILSGGDMGPIKIGGDLQGFRILGGHIEAGGKIARITIGGSVVGAEFGASGEIVAAAGFGPVKIGHDLVGGGGSNNTGFINATAGDLASLTIGGSIVGRGGTNSGVVNINGDIGPVKVGGDIVGGSGAGQASGAVFSIAADGSIARLTVGGSVLGGSQQQSGYVSAHRIGDVVIGRSLVGGTGNFSGIILGTDTIGAVRIGGNIEGGSAFVSADLFESGLVRSLHIKSVFVGGSIISGSDQTTGTYFNCGAIRAAADIGAIIVKGSLIGNVTNPVYISARGQPTTTHLAIKSISVGGSVEFGRILAGFDVSSTGIDGNGGQNADAQIGAVVVGGDWIRSSILAGVNDHDNDGNGIADGTGDADDTKLLVATDSPSIVSRIASITIKGTARGTPASDNSVDHYGFVAEQIGSFTIAGTKIPLKPGAGNPDDVNGYPIGVTGDLRVREVIG